MRGRRPCTAAGAADGGAAVRPRPRAAEQEEQVFDAPPGRGEEPQRLPSCEWKPPAVFLATFCQLSYQEVGVFTLRIVGILSLLLGDFRTMLSAGSRGEWSASTHLGRLDGLVLNAAGVATMLVHSSVYGRRICAR